MGATTFREIILPVRDQFRNVGTAGLFAAMLGALIAGGSGDAHASLGCDAWASLEATKPLPSGIPR